MENKIVRHTRPVHQESEKVSRMKSTSNTQPKTRNNKPPTTHHPLTGGCGGGEYFMELKKQIKELPDTQQQELLDYILLLRVEGKTTSDQDRKLSMWCDSLNTELGNMLGQTQRVFPQVHTTQAKKLLKDVTEFLSVNDLGNLKTEEVKLMYNLLAKILVNSASVISTRARIPLSMKLVLQTTTPVVSLFDNHFPGYVKAKLIRQILFAGKNGITREQDYDED